MKARCAIGSLITAALLTTTGRSLAAPPPDGTVIYCRVNATNNASTIWQAALDGTSDTLLTNGYRAHLSLDRRSLVFTRDGASGTAYNSQGYLWVRNLVTGAETQLYSYGFDYLIGADFTRDAARVIFDFSCSIYSIKSDGSDSNNPTGLLGGNCYHDATVVNPVDGRVAFHNTFSGVLVGNTNAQNPSVVPNTTLGVWPHWSWNGQWLSFVNQLHTEEYQGHNLFKVRPDGSGATQLTFFTNTADVFAEGAAWNRDGTALIGAATIGGTNGLYSVAADGGTITRLNITQAGDPIRYVGVVLTKSSVPLLAALTGSTAIPGGTGNFTSLPRGGSLSGNNVAFFGAGSGGQAGIYFQSRFKPEGPPIKIADLNTLIPGGVGNFASFTGDSVIPGDPCVSGDNVTFYGTGSGGQKGIYASFAGALAAIADTQTAIPGGTGNFTGFTRPGVPPGPFVSGNNVVFYGEGSGGQQGVYARVNNSLTKIADLATAIPGGTGNFTAIPGDPCISGDGVAFVGSGSAGQQGLYFSKASVLSVLADTHTAIPGGVGNFTAIPGDPCISGDSLAFAGNGAGGQQGVYLALPVLSPQGPPIRVADTSTMIPGANGAFTGFGAVSVSETDVAFLGTGAGGQTGIYDLTGGQLLKVVALGDSVGGKTVSGLGFARTGLSGDPVAFQATFNDGSEGIFTADVIVPPFTLRITAVERLGNDLRLSFSSLAGTNYAIQGRTDLVFGSWATLPGTTNSGTGGMVPVTLTNALTAPQQFYRVWQLP